jgi:hypothetical protein
MNTAITVRASSGAANRNPRGYGREGIDDLQISDPGMILGSVTMIQGCEFTHEGDICALEVLMKRTGIRDRALTPLAEMVHDSDLKESKFGRPETIGFALMINAVCAVHKEDELRLERGSAALDCPG